jgi:hypothetical protein
MKWKITIAVALLGFAAVSVGYLVVKGCNSRKGAAPTAAGILSKPAPAARGTAARPAGVTTAAPSAVTAAGAEPATLPKPDDKVVTVYWFYDNKH